MSLSVLYIAKERTLFDGTFENDPSLTLYYAHNSKLALQIAQRELPGLILFDLESLGGHAEYLLERLQRDITTSDIPIVILSDLPNHKVRELFPFFNLRYLLQKPFDAELLSTIFETIQRNENQFLGSYTNRFIKSFVTYWSTQTTANKMIALLDVLNEYIPIPQRTLHDMRSALAALSTTYKSGGLKKTIELFKDMRFTQDVIHFMQGAVHPSSRHEMMVYTIYRFMEAESADITPRELSQGSVDADIFTTLLRIYEHHITVVKNLNDRELVWQKVMEVVTLDDRLDYELLDPFLREIRTFLKAMMVNRDKVHTEILRTHDALEFHFDIHNCQDEHAAKLDRIPHADPRLTREIKRENGILKLALIYPFKSSNVHDTISSETSSLPSPSNHAEHDSSSQIPIPELTQQAPPETFSAKEYLEGLAETDYHDDLMNMSELEEEWEELILYENTDYYESFRTLAGIIQEYGSRINNSFYDFKNIALALTQLSDTLYQTIEAQTIETGSITKLDLILSHLCDDLIRWRNTIFITADTPNIHYLDSSLLSSCIQIEGFLKPKEEDAEEDDEIEFF